MPPEGSVDDDSDEDGGMPEDQDDDDDPECPQVADLYRSRTESLE